ncbi:hypothetical protein CSC94_23010 [Zhengella mangrovi]|uniref:Uncharacterized protein n=1 Tax=Zhengella mangrovi TaxID=1982044 RepID=A0A2G1QGX0_9HYPH|nr:hypothetical protein [Zhengella mangrovi]PHP64700.1 hypothetical protein CSC94_23010 [Zhengella mangrovi]
MKDTRKALKPMLLEWIEKGREAAAAPFAPEALRKVMSEMSKQGFSELRISPALPVDVRKTETAKAGRLFLDREGIENGWESASMPTDERLNPSRMSGEFYDLVIQIKP